MHFPSSRPQLFQVTILTTLILACSALWADSTEVNSTATGTEIPAEHLSGNGQNYYPAGTDPTNSISSEAAENQWGNNSFVASNKKIWDIIRRHLRSTTERPTHLQTFSHRKWIGDLFQQAEANLQIPSEVRPRCRRDFQRFKTNLENNTFWARRMFDASEWPIKGTITGDIYRLGNWEECLMVQSGDLKGKYCAIDTMFKFPLNENSSYGNNVYYEANEESSIWDTLQMYSKNPIRIPRYVLRWAFCVPSSCNENDLTLSLAHTLTPLFNNNSMNVSIRVVPHSCSTKENISGSYPASFYLVIALIGGIVVPVTIFGTVDLWNKSYKKSDSRTSNPGRQIPNPISFAGGSTPFSWVYNMSKDLSYVRNFMAWTNTKKDSNVHFGNALKTVYMMLIIFGHRGLYSARVPGFNNEMSEVKYPYTVMAVNLTVVDVFFFFSGFLLVHFGLKPMKKVGGIYTVIASVIRWIRLVPVLCIVQLIVIYVLPYLGKGPLWNAQCQYEIENCKASFLANLLSISNLFSVEKQCLIVSWYVSVDMQLNVIGCILLYAITRNRAIGIGITIFTMAISMLVTFGTALLKHYHGILLAYLTVVYEPRIYEEFYNFYISFYPRLGPYILGMLSALWVTSLKKKNYQFPIMLRLILVPLTLIIKVLVMGYAMQFYELNRPFNVYEHAIFAAIHRVFYVLFDACCLIIDMTTNLGILSLISRWKGFIPMARISYSVFIINTVVQFFHVSSQRTSIDGPSTINQLFWTMGDIGWTYIFGSLLYLFIEVPIYNVGKTVIEGLFGLFLNIMMPPTKKKNDSENDKDNGKNTKDIELLSEIAVGNNEQDGNCEDSGVNSRNSSSPESQKKTRL